MKDKRAHPRYDITKVQTINARTDRDLIEERLVSISIGGCGFCSSAESFSLKVGDKVTCWFTTSTHSGIKVVGHILYIVPHPMVEKIGRFFGIGFLANQEEELRPLLDEIESLHTQGLASIA